jgi:alpha-L-glutamate ligase-like protein
MNQRNAACILDHNPRSAYPVVDDKRRMRDLCLRIGVPTPAIFVTVRSHSSLGRLPALLKGRDDFVVKPNRGAGGRGILVVTGRDGEQFLRHDGRPLTPTELRQHVSNVISGLFSLGGQPDEALVQQRVRSHPAFASIAWHGIPDVRVIVYKKKPAMAMLRLPTRESAGRANLHQGGIGAGIDLDTGRTVRAVHRDRFIARHPDTDASLIGFTVPFWSDVLEMSVRVAAAIDLGFLGIDVVIDRDQGPLLLEGNARPGLAIQIANGAGLLPRLEAIDRHSLGERGTSFLR